MQIAKVYRTFLFWLVWVSLGCAVGFTLNALRAETLSSISCLPSALTSGQTSTCTVSLTNPAASSQLVNLAASSTAFTIPPTVTVPFNSVSASFVATANIVAVPTPVTVSATIPGVSALVTVSPIPAPPGAYTLSFSTYHGGTLGDWVRDVSTDAQGNIYIVGGTASNDLPVTAGAYDISFNGNVDVFLAKYTPAGVLVCSTFLGGPNYDRAYALEVDATGVYVAGRAGDGFPTTPGAPQPNFAGDNNPSSYGLQDGFITKLSLDCSQVLWSTYIGDLGPGFIRDIALDGVGGVYAGVSGVRDTLALVGPGVYDSTLNGANDGALVKLTTDGVFQWATYIGSPGEDGFNPSVRADASGAYWLLGTNSALMPVTMGPAFGGVWDRYLAKISPDGMQLLLGRYLGGTGADYCETHCLALDGQGNIFAAFSTQSTGIATAGVFDTTYNGLGNYPACGNYCGDGIVMKLNSAGLILAATYFGGTGGEGIEGVGVDAAGNVYIGGGTYSADLPMVGGSYQNSNAGNGDFFIAKFSSDLSQLLYSSYVGGTGVDFGRSLHADAAGAVYLGGQARAGFPTVNAQQPASANGNTDDGVLDKFAP